MNPLLRYGPSRTPGLPAGRPITLPRPPKEILTTLNPAFMERRAALFLDGMRLVREAYPTPIADEIALHLPTQRMVQAPLFVGNVPLRRTRRVWRRALAARRNGARFVRGARRQGGRKCATPRRARGA